MVALGTILVGVLGLVVGFRGGLVSLLAGFGVTSAVAAVQFAVIHEGAGLDYLPDWPWGATSLLVYVLGLAVGVAASHNH